MTRNGNLKEGDIPLSGGKRYGRGWNTTDMWHSEPFQKDNRRDCAGNPLLPLMMQYL
jgi:hypothetical protein